MRCCLERKTMRGIGRRRKKEPRGARGARGSSTWSASGAPRVALKTPATADGRSRRASARNQRWRLALRVRQCGGASGKLGRLY